MANIYGTWGNDTLVGTIDGDYISGYAGDDLLQGGNGDDYLWGGEGTDTLDGGEGIDIAVLEFYASTVGISFAVADNLSDVVTLANGSMLSNIELIHFYGSGFADSITGGTLSDYLFGNGGDDSLLGGDGNDDLAGGEGQDTVSGGSGSDTVTGGVGADSLAGDAGDDTLVGGSWPTSGPDTLDGGEGIDFAALDFTASTAGINFAVADNLERMVALANGISLRNIEQIEFYGSEAADSVAGGALSDRLLGNGGDDSLFGGDGNDYLEGGEGEDNLTGDAGDDTLAGGWSATPGRDTLDGGEGIDVAELSFHASTVGINFAVADNLSEFAALADGSMLRNIERVQFSGSEVADSITGGTLSDYLFGNGGDDSLLGGDGSDYLEGNRGDDTLVGGEGNDALRGGGGVDSLVGSNGDDTLGYFFEGDWEFALNPEWDDTRGDTLDGGDGTDLASVDCWGSPEAITFVLADNLIAPVALADGTVISSIEQINFRGSAAADSLVGGLLDDYLEGGGGDTLEGGGGNDTLAGGTNLSGGDGNDMIFVWSQYALVSGGAGNDTLGQYLPPYTDSDGFWDEYWPNTSGDTLDGGDGTDWATVNGDAVTTGISFALADNLAEVVRLSDGTVLSNIERVYFRGSPAADSLAGGGLGDRLHGEGGNDTLIGSGGRDTLEGGGGKDTLMGGRDQDRIVGEAGRDVLFGDAGADTLLGGNGADRLVGGWGSDQLSGDADSDRLSGGGGNDSLAGGFGNDTLDGDDGSDMLTGGAGSDVFVFDPDSHDEASLNSDTITDFTSGSDTIRLDRDIFTALAEGALAPEQFHSEAGAVTAQDGDDRILYTTTTGALYFDPDGTGITAAVQFAVLGTTTHPAITAADFVIVG